MATILVCPSCGRRLNRNDDLPPETPVACPGCLTVFNLPTGESVAADSIPRASATRPIAEATPHKAAPVEVTRLEVPAVNRFDDEPSVSRWPDDDDDWLTNDLARRVRRPVFRRFAVTLLFLLLAGMAVALILSRDKGDLVGSWRGKFQFAGFDLACVYEFRRDGTFVDEHVDPNLGVRVRFAGRYAVANGQVTITWFNGGFEQATFLHTAPDTIEYTIVAHTDLGQVGCRATFVRERH